MANAPQRNYSALAGGTRLFKQCPTHGTRALNQCPTSPSVSLDTAIRLVSQAVHQDTAKNYAEAARCYREAIAVFHAARNGGNVSRRVRAAIDEKCALYEARLRKLERHLLHQADLTKLFRKVVSSQGPRPVSVASNSSSEHSEGSVELHENPHLKEGVEKIRRAKREDSKGLLREAVHFYELGAGLLLDAVRRGQVPEAQLDSVRIKCLLTHDRCELIKNHLERGVPLRVRKEALETLEYSLESGGSPHHPESPLHQVEEEQQLLMMEEVQSNVGGSRHSLYPSVVCVQQQESAFNRSESIISGQSDYNSFAKSKDILEDDEDYANNESERLIPLADLKNELKLSYVSVSSSSCHSSDRSSSVATTPRRRLSLNSMDRAAADVDLTDSILVLDASGRLSELDRDANDTFVSPEMIEVEQKELLLQRGDMVMANVIMNNDSGSDSGYSDPSIDHVAANKSPVSTVESKSPLSDIDSLDIVPATPTRGQTPVSGATSNSDGSSPRPIRLNSQSLRSSPRPQSQRSSRKSSGQREVTAPEDTLEVLSVDNVNVINGLLVKETTEQPEELELQSRPGSRRSSGRSRKSVRVKEPEDMYAPARPRTEYVPPRAFATRRDTIPEEEDEDDVNGCYYFMACLDTFWIL